MLLIVSNSLRGTKSVSDAARALSLTLRHFDSPAALSALMAGGIALFQRWWDRRKHVPVEVPIQPAVVGIGGVDAKIAAKIGPGPVDGDDGHPSIRVIRG